MRWPPLLRRYLKRPPPGSGDFTQDLDKFLPGNDLKLLRGGQEAFAAMWEAIAAARSTVHLETYIFGSDRTGEEFARRLMDKAKQGVAVRVIYDSVGCLNTDPILFYRMSGAGVKLLEYHPVAPWRANWGWWRRDHRKILVVDGRVAFSGGINISHDYAPKEEGGSAWHDTHLRIEGPAAHELDQLFRSVWFKETKKWFPASNAPEPAPDNSLVWVAANQEFLQRHIIRRGYLRALRAAQREVRIANAYFLPDRKLRRALAAAARRGVSVRVLVPGRSDHIEVWRAGRRTYDELLRSGVRIFEWQDSIMHAKTAVIDGAWCAVGSYNFDHLSLRQNLEVDLHVLDHALAARMKSDFEADLDAARELKLGEWRRRPRLDKLREWFWYKFRYFF